MQHVTCDTGGAFLGVDKMLQETFLPRLFFRKKNTLTQRRRSKYNAGQ